MAKRKHTDDEKVAHALHEALARLEGATEDELAYIVEYDRKMGVLTSMMRRNFARQEQMAAQHGVALDETAKMLGYLKIVVDKLFPEDTIERLDLEMEFEAMVDASLNQPVPTRKPDLVVPGKGGLVVPGRG